MTQFFFIFIIKKAMKDYKNFEEYISVQDEKARDILQLLRNIVIQCAPEVEESISYGMPAYKTFGKPLVYFAAFKNHIGLYATPSGHEAFSEQLKIYKQGKGSVQFPLDTPIPYDLIRDIVMHRVIENRAKFAPSINSNKT
jgi:uncharacterized protein YdhG (YjbR/CyaY superfamily)